MNHRNWLKTVKYCCHLRLDHHLLIASSKCYSKNVLHVSRVQIYMSECRPEVCRVSVDLNDWTKIMWDHREIGSHKYAHYGAIYFRHMIFSFVLSIKSTLTPYASGADRQLKSEILINIFFWMTTNRAVELALQFQRKTDEYGKLYSVIPVVAKLFPEKSDFNAGRRVSIRLFEIFKKMIDAQISTHDANHDRNFIDMYVRKMLEAEAKGDAKSTFSCEWTFYRRRIWCHLTLHNFPFNFSDDQLILTCIDFAFPSLSAISMTVTFLIQQVCIDPNVQKKIQDEIDHVVGEGRLPTLDDRIK